MEEPPAHLLESLASIDEQRRYIINATVDEYLLVDEIINDAWHFCERAERPVTFERLSESQRASVARLKEAIEKLTDCVDLYHDNAAELIERDICWSVMRDRAKETMIEFGHPSSDQGK